MLSLDKIVCIGEALYELVPQSGGGALCNVPIFTRNAGGAPANVAIAISKLGGNVRFIGKIGDDPFGQYIESVFAQHAVEAALLLTKEAKTGVTFISLREDGERDFVFCNEPSADLLLSRTELREEWLADAAFCHFGSRSLMRDGCRMATLYTARRVRETGGVVSFDPNIRLPLWNSAEAARHIVSDHLQLADIVKVSDEELDFLLPGVDVLHAARTIFDKGVKVVVITLGEAGCRVMTRHHDLKVPGLTVSSVDTTGAGDGFVGAMLFQLQSRGIQRSDLADALSDSGLVGEIFTFANVTGALTATRYGAISAMPWHDEVIRSLPDDGKRGVR